MLTASKCMQMILAVLLVYVVSAYAYHPDLAYMRSRFPFQMHRLNDRSIDGQGTSSDPAAPVRKDGKSLGSLLLKNLRFRDLENIFDGDNEEAAAYQQGKDSPLIPGRFENTLFNPKKLAIVSGNKNGLSKRQGVSVSDLAQYLNNLKARNVDDDGVKLQSLRFGK